MALLQDYKVLFEQNTEIKEIFYQGQRIWPSVMSIDPYKKPYTITNVDTVDITFSVHTLYNYSIDGGEWTASTGSITLQPGSFAQFKISEARTSALTILPSWTYRTLKFNVGGNIHSLLDGENYEEITSIGAAAFNDFYAYYAVDVDDLVLPATTYTGSGSQIGCYESMFRNCTRLTKSPKIELTELSSDCCYLMFNGCTNLTEITCLATTISKAPYKWVAGVAANGTFYCKDSSIWETGDSGIPSGWTVVEV